MKKEKDYTVKIGTNAWLTDTDANGDPPRTIVQDNALKIESLNQAKRLIKKACKTHPQRPEVLYTVFHKNVPVLSHKSLYGSDNILKI